MTIKVLLIWPKFCFVKDKHAPLLILSCFINRFQFSLHLKTKRHKMRIRVSRYQSFGKMALPLWIARGTGWISTQSGNQIKTRWFSTNETLIKYGYIECFIPCSFVLLALLKAKERTSMLFLHMSYLNGTKSIV